MISFADFVGTVWTQFEKRFPGTPLSQAMVEEVLAETGIPPLFEQETISVLPKKVLLHTLWVSGHKRKRHLSANEVVPFSYQRHLEVGVNGWIAGNGTGKSTLLKLVVWAITGVEPALKQDIRSWIEDVAVEISIADVLYTIRYFPRMEAPKVTGFIVQQDLETCLHQMDTSHILASFSGAAEMGQQIALFFREKMHFAPLLSQPQDALSQTTSQTSVSWNVYAQALFLGADYTDYLFPKRSDSGGKSHQKTLSIYLGLGSPEALTRLEIAYENVRDEYRFESRRVTTNAQGVREKIEDLEEELRGIAERLQAIEQGQSVLVDPAYLTHVQEQIAEYTTRVVDLSLSEQQLLKEERETQKKLGDMQRACQELREAIQFKVFLSGLSIERCPNCEQAISPERIEEEMHKKQCRLCLHELRPVQSVEHYEIMLQETSKTVVDLERTLRTIKKDVRKTIGLRKQEENALEHWRSELQDLPRQERAGFTQEVRELLDRRGYLNGQLQQLREQTEEVHSQQLTQLKTAQDILEVALIEMRGLIWQHAAHQWNQLQERTTQLARLFGITDLEHVSFSISERFNLFIKQGGNTILFREMEASEMLRLKLAFHLALLLLHVTDGIGYHPGLLIVDAPGGAEMDDHHFQNILQGFLNAKSQLGDQAQILIASTKASLTSICDAVEQRAEDTSLF